MARKDTLEFRKKHGRLVKGWRKILDQERGLDPDHNFLVRIEKDFGLSRLPTRQEALALARMGRKLSEMGENGRKVKRSKRLTCKKANPVQITFVSGGLPSLGKGR